MQGRKLILLLAGEIEEIYERIRDNQSQGTDLNL
jgi:hypothetical protein